METCKSFPFSPFRLYRVKRKIQLEKPSFKTLQIAKRMHTSSDLPKPLTCEEDFIIEQTKSYSDFLKPVSGFYELPQLPEQRKIKFLNEYKKRDIVGSMECFHKQWRNLNECRSQGAMKKGRSFVGFGNPVFAKQNTLFVTDTMEIPNVEKVVNVVKKQSKVKVLFEKQQDYWKRINENIGRKVTVRKVTKKSNFLMVPRMADYMPRF